MGWISRKAEKGSYVARYRDPAGREHSKSFRTRAEAKAFLNAVEMQSNAVSGQTQQAPLVLCLRAEPPRRSTGPARIIAVDGRQTGELELEYSAHLGRIISVR